MAVKQKFPDDLYKYYREEARYKLQKDLNISNINAVPKLLKIGLNHFLRFLLC